MKSLHFSAIDVVSFIAMGLVIGGVIVCNILTTNVI